MTGNGSILHTLCYYWRTHHTSCHHPADQAERITACRSRIRISISSPVPLTGSTHTTVFGMLHLHVIFVLTECMILHGPQSEAFSRSLVLGKSPCSDFGLEELVDFFEGATLK